MVKKVIAKNNKKKVLKKTPPKKYAKSVATIKKTTLAKKPSLLKKILKSSKKIVAKVSKKPTKKLVVKTQKKIEVAPTKKGVRLHKSINNPIIKPRLYGWESKATMNPAAILAKGKVHIVYRAIGDDDNSVLGYASSFNGYQVEERPTYHIFRRSFETLKKGIPISYNSGGGWSGGCEDPRLTLFGDTVYLLYVAFDGWSSVRIGLTSIALSDFQRKIWNWKTPVLISPPGAINKNWVLFPEKINGRYAILHSISPKVLIDYVDDMDEFDGKKFIHSISQHDREKDVRETGIRGVGPSPIKTKHGWLILYHGIEKNDPGKYKLWVLVLDYKNPTKVLYRSANPVLEPEALYENEGHKAGVVYCCGAVVKAGRLFVYYGGADTFVCVASITLDELFEDLIEKKPIELKNYKLAKKKIK